MQQDIHNRQLTLTMIRNERNRVQRRLQGAEQHLKEAVRLRDQLRTQLSKEQQDVIKLGKFSFMNKIKEWTGKWDEEMDREMREVTEAELRYNEAEKVVADMEAEVTELQNEMSNPDFTYIEEEWEDFLKEKAAWIRQHDSIAHQTLQKIADDRVRLRSLLREIEEAYDYGKIAIHALDKAMDKLNSAEGMSIWDTFLGGGLVASALKHSEMSDSEDLVHQAQRALRHYRTELMDVQNMAAESFTISQNDIFAFTDLFFDNFFSDWMVHSRITDAQSQIHEVLQDVRRVQDQLARKRDEAEEELNRINQQEKDIIVS
ncbi:hypothetical protein AB1K83_08525 [Sporosarcina sp. 179-K 3D1 HS]|uniref:hypothetical protein n=1 Tax=Sporosarcina sp. 179-K 3D1 HS TaxID=3232169 RepID=UPI0039A3705E